MYEGTMYKNMPEFLQGFAHGWFFFSCSLSFVMVVGIHSMYRLRFMIEPSNNLLSTAQTNIYLLLADLFFFFFFFFFGDYVRGWMWEESYHEGSIHTDCWYLGVTCCLCFLYSFLVWNIQGLLRSQLQSANDDTDNKKRWDTTSISSSH